MNNSIVLQLNTKSGFGSQLADKITSYLKKDEQYMKLNK